MDTINNEEETTLANASVVPTVPINNNDNSTEITVADETTRALSTIAKEEVFQLDIETPVNIYSLAEHESKASDLLLVTKNLVDIDTYVARVKIGNDTYDIYPAKDSDDCNFNVFIDDKSVKGYITASFEQVSKLVDDFRAKAQSLIGSKQTFFYKSPMLKLLNCVRGARVQDYKNFMTSYPNAFFKEDKKQILEQVSARTYDVDLAGKVQCNPVNLACFCEIYGYILTYNRVKNNVLITSRVKEFSGQLEAQESLKYDLQKEGIGLKDLQEQLLILAVLKYKSNQSDKANLSCNLLGAGKTTGFGFNTEEPTTSLNDEVMSYIIFDSDEDEVNFKDTFEMMMVDIIRKVTNASSFNLENDALASKQYFYNIIADEIGDVEMLLNSIFKSVLKEYYKAYSQKNFQKLLDGANDSTVVCYTPIENLKNQVSLNDYISVPTFDATITKTYTEILDKFTVLIGGMEHGDLLPFKIKNIVNIKFSSLDFEKLQNIDWSSYFQNLILKHQKGQFLENLNVIKCQKRLQYDLLEDGVHDMLGTIIGAYEINHKEHQKTTCNAKFIIQKFGLTEIDTLSDHMKLSKKLRRIKILSEIKAKGFKISDSLFHISYEDLVAKYIF